MIAIIPARGGSKGLPGKNIKELNGKPLIAYTIEAAKQADCIDKAIVSTDDEAIAATAQKYGAEVPFVRPHELASDTSSAIDVYLHAIDFLEKKNGTTISKFMVLLPTAPFRTNRHIDEAYELYCKEKAQTLISVTEAETPPGWYLTKNEHDRIQNAGFGKELTVMGNRQINQAYYIPNGAIYILDTALLKTQRTYYSDNTVPYIMAHGESVDIDTMADFEYAKYLMLNVENNSYKLR